MSPRRRQIRRLRTGPRRERRELVTAVVSSGAVVILTAVAIWLLRPDGPAKRQYRVAWLVGGAALVLVAALWWVWRSRARWARRRSRTVPAVVAAVVAAAVVAGFLWPGGLLLHPVGIPDLGDLQPPLSVPDSSTPGSSAATTSTPGASEPSTPTSSTPGSSVPSPSTAASTAAPAGG